MNVITFESEAYQKLVEKIDTISQHIDESLKSVNPDDAWIDSDDVCNFLNISQRTLQRLRSSGDISYSILGGKTYYTITDIKRLLETRKVKSRVDSVDELCDVYHERISKLGNGA